MCHCWGNIWYLLWYWCRLGKELFFCCNLFKFWGIILQYMCHGAGAERAFPIATNSYHGTVDQMLLHRISTQVSLHETTKICFRNQQVNWAILRTLRGSHSSLFLCTYQLFYFMFMLVKNNDKQTKKKLSCRQIMMTRQQW